MNRDYLYLAMLALVIMLINISCASTPQPPLRPDNLTYGMVSQSIVRGKSTQNQILAVFGPPNIFTKNADGNDVWTYDKVSIDKDARARGAYGTILLAGIESSKYQASSSSSTVTLSVTFDGYDYVKDYDYYQTRY